MSASAFPIPCPRGAPCCRRPQHLACRRCAVDARAGGSNFPGRPRRQPRGGERGAHLHNWSHETVHRHSPRSSRPSSTTTRSTSRTCSNVVRWMTTPLTGLVVLGSNGEAPSSTRTKQIGSSTSCSRNAREPADDRRNGSRVHPRHDCRDPARCRWCRRRARADARILQGADDHGRVCAALRRSGRRVAHPGVALQRDDV